MDNSFRIDWLSIRITGLLKEDLLRLFLEYFCISVDFLFKTSPKNHYRNAYNIVDRYTSVYYDDTTSEVLFVFSGSSSFLVDIHPLFAFIAYHSGISFTYRCTRIDIAYDDYKRKSFYSDLEACISSPLLNLCNGVSFRNIKIIKNYSPDGGLYCNYMFNSHSHVRSLRIYNKKDQLSLPVSFLYRSELEFRSDNKNSLADNVFNSVINGCSLADLFLVEMSKLFSVPRISGYYDSYQDYVMNISSTSFLTYNITSCSAIDLENEFCRKFESFKSNLSFLKLLSLPEFSFYHKELQGLIAMSSLNKKDAEFLNFFKTKLSNR